LWIREIISEVRGARLETSVDVFAKFVEVVCVKVFVDLNPPFEIIICILAGIYINNQYIIILLNY